MTRTLLLLVAFGVLAFGCKRPKPTEPANTESASAKPAPQPVAPSVAKKPEKEPEKSWLKAPIGGQKKTEPEPLLLPVDSPANGGKQSWGISPPPGPVGQNPQPQPGGGVLQPNPAPANPPPVAAPNNTPLGASARLVGQKDMFDLQIFIHDSSLVMNRMPTAAETYAALVAAGSPAAKLVKDGAIILTGAKDRESVWAFEARAYLSGGFAVSQNGVETLTADELKKRLGK